MPKKLSKRNATESKRLKIAKTDTGVSSRLTRQSAARGEYKASEEVTLKVKYAPDSSSSRQTRQTVTKSKVMASTTDKATSSTSKLDTNSVDEGYIPPTNGYHKKHNAVICINYGYGSGDSEFCNPMDVAVNVDGDRVYVVDAGNHRVQIFDSNGRFLSTFGLYGKMAGEFFHPTGIAVNSHDEVFISDHLRIQVYDRNDIFKYFFGNTGLLAPTSMAIDRLDNVYVCTNEDVQVFKRDGIFIRKFAPCGYRPTGIALYPRTERVYVTDFYNHRIHVYSSQGEFLSLFGAHVEDADKLNYPSGIVVDEEGFVIVSEPYQNRVRVFREDGTFFCTIGSSEMGAEIKQFKSPLGLALNKCGNLIVADFYNNMVQIF